MSATVFKFFQPKGESLLACRFSWVPEWRTLGIIYSPGQFQSIGKILQRKGRISFVEHKGERHASDYCFHDYSPTYPRTYRSRKEKYTRTLEAAFARSQAHEELLLKERARLRATVQRLVETLNQNGIQAPEDCIQHDDTTYNQDYMWVGSPTSDSSLANSHSTHQSPPQIKYSAQAVNGLTPPSDTHSEPPHTHSPVDGNFTATTLTQNGTALLCEFDEVSVGMDFILS